MPLAAALPSGAAGVGALSPRAPMVPHAERRLVAPTRTLADLLPCGHHARSAAKKRLLLHMPKASPLTTATAAGTPLAPLCPEAILWLLAGANAILLSARTQLGKISATTLTSSARHLEDAALAPHLAAAARDGALAPRPPICKLAVGWRVHGTRLRQIIARVARRGLLEWSAAPCALSAALDGDHPGASFETVATSRTSAPGPPRCELAAPVRDARHVLVARAILARQAYGRLAKLVSLALDWPHAPGDPTAAGCRAALPVLPIAP